MSKHLSPLCVREYVLCSLWYYFKNLLAWKRCCFKHGCAGFRRSNFFCQLSCYFDLLFSRKLLNSSDEVTNWKVTIVVNLKRVCEELSEIVCAFLQNYWPYIVNSHCSTGRTIVLFPKAGQIEPCHKENMLTNQEMVNWVSWDSCAVLCTTVVFEE